MSRIIDRSEKIVFPWEEQRGGLAKEAVEGYNERKNKGVFI